MIYSVILNLVKTAHLTLGYAHHFRHLLRYSRSHIRMNLLVTEQKAQLIIELSDISTGMFKWIEMVMLDCLSC